MISSHIESLLSKLPHTPGVYKMKDETGRIIYVGKAKDLHRRVHSYFREQKNRPMRTQKLVEHIIDLEWIEVGSDLEALFLETNLIKELHPKYNVLMKDDKNFVYIKVTLQEDFPRLEIVRRVLKDGARYFGPKTSAHSVRKLLTLLQKLFHYRSCDLGLKWHPQAEGSQDSAQNPEASGLTEVTRKTISYPCLDFHIKRCDGPCISKITPEDYRKNIDQILGFLEGDTEDLERDLKLQMQKAAEAREYEKAALIRDKLLALQNLTQERQIVTSPDQDNMDVIAFVIEGEKAYTNLFMLREGKLLNHENFILDAGGFLAGDEPEASDLIEAFITQYYQEAAQFPRQILIAQTLEEPEFLEEWLTQQSGRKVQVLTPQRGKKHELLELAEKNARSFQKQHKARWENTQPDVQDTLKELAQHLNLAKAPQRLECYDISHLGGTDTVASMVVFEKGKPKTSDYRKFRLDGIAEGEIDDFKSMEEILKRRLRYLSKGPSGVSFRRATKKDQAALQAQLKTWKGEEILAGDLKEYWVAREGENHLGFLRFQTNKDHSTALLRALYVEETARQRGIGRALLRHAIEKLKVRRVYVRCAQDRKPFYESFGFEPIKLFPEEFKSILEQEGLWEETEKKGWENHAFDPKKYHDASFAARPDVIVIDGGKGQLGRAVLSRDSLGLQAIPMVGLAKREEEIFFPEKSLPLLLPEHSPALLMLRHLRDEAHRFAITFQRSSRKKHLIASVLDGIPGLGKDTKMKLLRHFKTIENIRLASVESIAELTGSTLAETIHSHLTQTL